MIVDGGSTDESVSIIERYGDRLEWWVSEPDKGQTDALNKALAEVTGDIVGFINSDDYYLPNAFDTAVKALESSSAQWVAGAARFEDEHGNVTEVWTPEGPSVTEWVIRGRHWWMLAPWSVPQPSSFWRRDVFSTIGGFRDDMHYVFDTEFFLRLAYAGMLPELVPMELAARVVHPGAKSADTRPFEQESRRFVSLFGPALSRRERVKLRFTQMLLKARFFSAYFRTRALLSKWRKQASFPKAERR